MSTKYFCKKCNYVTNRSTDLKRHEETKKHLDTQEKCDTDSDEEYTSVHNSTDTPQENKSIDSENNQKNNKCKYCNKKFTSKSSMYRHIRMYCSAGNKKLNKDLEIIELKEQVNKLVDTLKIIADIAHCAIKNFKVAPTIKLLEKDVAIGLLTHMETEKRSFWDWLVFYHEKYTIHEFIGDMIVRAYKKEDSDGSEWVSDRSGTKIKKLIINPLLKQIKIKLMEYKKK